MRWFNDPLSFMTVDADLVEVDASENVVSRHRVFENRDDRSDVLERTVDIRIAAGSVTIFRRDAPLARYPIKCPKP